MPKQALHISDISRGIHSDSSPETAPNGSVVLAENVLLDRIGRIRPTSGFNNVASVAIDNYEAGLYSFRTDNRGQSPEEYVLSQNGSTVTRRIASSLASQGTFSATSPSGFVYSNGNLYIYPKIGSSGSLPSVIKAGSWGTKYDVNYNTQQLTTGIWLDDGLGGGSQFQSGDPAPDIEFLLEKDAVTISGEFAKASIDLTNKTYSYNTIQFDYLGQTYQLSNVNSGTTDALGFNLQTAINASNSPCSAVFNSSTNILTLTSSVPGVQGNGIFVIYRDGAGITLATGEFIGGTESTFDDAGNIDKVIPAGKYTFAASFVLWDGSETSLSNISSSITFDDRTKVALRVRVNYSSFTDFVKGVKFYISSESFEFSLLGEYKPSVSRRFKFYNEGDFNTNDNLSHEIDITLPFYSTFQFEAGYDPEKLATPIMNKFIIANNRGFALGVGYDGNYHQDRIIVSPYGKPLLLPEDNSIDIVTEDGDEYITAEHYSQFLFCFKKYTLFILNISSNNPSSYYLQSSHYGVGVNSEKSVAKGEIGLFWANENGIYYHDGKQLQNLTKGKIEDDWESIASSDIIAGYDIIEKKALFIRGNTTFVYDVYTQSFTKLTEIGSGNKSRFVTRDDRLTLVVNGQAKEYNSSQSASSWKIVTKAYDMSAPSVRKKIRRFYLTFSEENVNLSNITLEYLCDDSDDWTTVTNKSFINNTDGVTKNTVAMFDLNRSITAYSVQLRITGTVQNELKTISIVFRAKSPK